MDFNIGDRVIVEGSLLEDAKPYEGQTGFVVKTNTAGCQGDMFLVHLDSDIKWWFMYHELKKTHLPNSKWIFRFFGKWFDKR